MTLKRRLAPTVLALSTLAACAPDSAGRQGESVNTLYDIFLVIAAVVFVVVSGLIGFSILRFRARPGDDALPEQTHTNLKLEIVWFAIPTVIVVVLFAMSVGVLGTVNEEADDPLLTVHVEGFQWGWRFAYEGSEVRLESLPNQPAEIVLPVSEPIAFFLTSPDVIHSFQLPAFLMKRDVVPGRTNRMDLEIARAGVYEGACAEFCGLQHAAMRFTIRAVPLEEFETWLNEEEG
jgi:cytochrome c oxidase subunit 2